MFGFQVADEPQRLVALGGLFDAVVVVNSGVMLVKFARIKAASASLIVPPGSATPVSNHLPKADLRDAGSWAGSARGRKARSVRAVFIVVRIANCWGRQSEIMS